MSSIGAEASSDCNTVFEVIRMTYTDEECMEMVISDYANA